MLNCPICGSRLLRTKYHEGIHLVEKNEACLCLRFTKVWCYGYQALIVGDWIAQFTFHPHMDETEKEIANKKWREFYTQVIEQREARKERLLIGQLEEEKNLEESAIGTKIVSYFKICLENGYLRHTAVIESDIEPNIGNLSEKVGYNPVRYCAEKIDIVDERNGIWLVIWKTSSKAFD